MFTILNDCDHDSFIRPFADGNHTVKFPVDKGYATKSDLAVKNSTTQVWSDYSDITIDDSDNNIKLTVNEDICTSIHASRKKAREICQERIVGADGSILTVVNSDRAEHIVTRPITGSSKSNMSDKGIADDASIKIIFSSKIEIFRFKSHRNPSKKGDLIPFDYSTFLPWIPKQMFLVTNVPSMEVRGNHAHESQKQFLVCVNGAIKVFVDDGENRIEVVLDTPEKGILFNAMIWSSQLYIQDNSSLLVFCSEVYNRSEYIDDYSEFVMKAKHLREGSILKQSSTEGLAEALLKQKNTQKSNFDR